MVILDPTYSQNQRHQCEICQKYFPRRLALENHLRTLTGDQPFACPMCAKRFAVKGNLKRHMVTHYMDNSLPNSS
ncbi:hypothetical protein DPMN_091110 [Dreissena polymorpha]|uniref:C2H2-type domain-containing protein n=2 Tax=Dreissena polymorpha TaxID=45954 RepID=A0A9D4R0E9_DREPO|nr:hypothetical protein DPMN_091110 [Dreissena polymorpha]